MTLAELRREYTLGGLRRNELSADPLRQLEKWLEGALEANVLEANAMTLATTNREGQPTIRTVLLKAIDERGLVFFTNYQSRKGRDMAENAKVSLLIYWRELERQAMVCGTATKVPRAESEAYFKIRPEGSQLAAWASSQSEPIPGREFLEKRLADVVEKFRGQTVPTPPQWGGYVVAPKAVEFWQGRVNRLHDRFCYTKVGAGWTIERLSP
jgi:pyridoxamine 5'-phosphate oxidase